MTFMVDFLVKISLIIYFIVLAYLLIRKRFTLGQHFLFAASFLIGVLMISLMFFPLDIVDYNYLPLQHARQYKHTALPFQYWIRDIFPESTLDHINTTYFNGKMTQIEVNQYRDGYQRELLQMIWFSVINMIICIILMYTRFWLVKDRASIKRSILTIIVYVFIIDLLYIIKYYHFSLDTDAFDTAFIFFQIFGLYIGYMLFRWTSLRMTIRNDKITDSDHGNSKVIGNGQ